MRLLFFLAFLTASAISFSLKAQSEIFSENGWYITPHGEIRLLIIFAEIEYDLNPQNEGKGWNMDLWKPGSLPSFADSYCDAHYTKPLKGRITRFYDFMSMGDYRVLGDYINYVVTLKESEVKGLNNIFGQGLRQAIADKINDNGFKTHHNLSPSDFDFWQDSKGDGQVKINLPDSSFDHVMVVLRNYHLMPGGYTNQGSFPIISGYMSDTYSIQGGNKFFIEIHEYSHMLLGGNNFHATGGQHLQGGANYFINYQGGHGLMGDANSTLVCGNAWDRYRLGWKHAEKQLLISALNENRLEEQADLDGAPKNTKATFWLRDFITYGDAIRIKLPHIPDHQFPQWLWIENHQGTARNGCEFDDYQYTDADCRESAPPGLHMYIQVDKDQKIGKSTYNGHYGDYIKPLPASGFYDLIYDDTLSRNNCINDAQAYAFERKSDFANAYTGASELDRPNNDFGDGKGGEADGRIEGGEIRLHFIEKSGDTYFRNLPSLGLPRHVFTLSQTPEIHLGTNPSTASTQTHVSYYKSYNHKQDNRSVYLNGIKIKIVEYSVNPENNQLEDIKVEVSFDHHTISTSMRWCADTIVIPPKLNGQAHGLVLDKRVQLDVDRGLTPTRMEKPDTVNGQFYFNQPTVIYIPSGSSLHLNKRAKINLNEGSQLVIAPGAMLSLAKRAVVKVQPGSKIVYQNGSLVKQVSKSKIIFK